MAKKRRTRTQKIIAQLKRELQKQKVYEQQITPDAGFEIVTKKSPPVLSFDYQSFKKDKIKIKATEGNQTQSNLYLYDPTLIKNDLLKTFYLSLLMFAFIGFCYWYFNFFK